MDSESSTKFIGSLTKFLQSLCNGYVEFDDGVELIGHIYLSVDAGKTGKTLNYFLNEKVCKNDNSVTFISNSFPARPEKGKSAKEGEGKKEDGDVSDSADHVKSTNAGTISSRQPTSRLAPSPGQNRSGLQTGTKRPGSPLKGPASSQRRAATPPSQRRMQSPAAKGPSGSPASKTVPSSPSSSSQDNIPSPSPARKHRGETSQLNQSDIADGESDIIPSNLLSINPPPEFANFLGSLTGDNQHDQHSPPDTKPDTDVTFIKEEYVSEPSSCAQTGSSGHHSGRANDDSLYPVMLHQNTSVFPSTSAGYPPGYPAGASSTATSQHPGFPGASTSQSDPFSPVPGTSQDGADPSGHLKSLDGTAICHRPIGKAKASRTSNMWWKASGDSSVIQHQSAQLASQTDEKSNVEKCITAAPCCVEQTRTSLHIHRLGADLSQSFAPNSTSSGSRSDEKNCGVPCCTGEYTNCLCGCQSYSMDTQLNLDPSELDKVRPKCTCSCCGLKFHNQSNLRRHQTRHFNIFKHHCSVCGHKFSRSDSLKLHMRRKHQIEFVG